MGNARYLVQTKDGLLHAYWDLRILLIDINANRDDSVKLYRLQSGGLTVKYAPVGVDELRAEAA